MQEYHQGLLGIRKLSICASRIPCGWIATHLETLKPPPQAALPSLPGKAQPDIMWSYNMNRELS